jgi:hypothetical protein
VESRKWRLDVLIPIIWMRLRLADLGLGIEVRAAAGDVLEPDRPLRLLKDGNEIDVADFFERSWNDGTLRIDGPGEGELSTTLDYEIADSVVRPDATVTIRFAVSGEAGLGYVTPKQARGIFDEDTQSFATIHFDVGATVKQVPEGGWQPVFDPHDLAIRLAGTVVTMRETMGLDAVQFTGITSVQGVEPHNRQFRWTRVGGSASAKPD